MYTRSFEEESERGQRNAPPDSDTTGEYTVLVRGIYMRLHVETILTCRLEILYAGPSNERSKVTGQAGVDRPKVTILSVIRNSTTLP